MNMIPTEEINAIRSNVDIVDIIASYIPLTPKGKNYFGKCPFHDDHSPSMSVSKDKQIYTCFSCGATGNVFKFVMDYEHVSFPESINIVANKAGLNYHIKTKELPRVHKELYEIYDLSAKIYQNNINTSSGKEAKEYLKNRDISDEAIKEFGIGLATQKRDVITNVLKNKNYKESDLLRSGIVIKSDQGLHDIYYNRIMFPIWDNGGQVVGFSGRVFHGETNYKYINTKETEIFKKGELLYNYHRAKEYARQKDTIIIMEGQLDVIRSFSVGIKNVIGTMGTAITKKHALLIKRLAKNVILCFDGDEAGAKATAACIKELQAIEIIPKVVRLPDGADPDEYIKTNGKEAFERLLEHPMPMMDFKLQYLKKGKDFDQATDVGAYVNDVMKELSLIEDDIVRELTLQKISEESKLDLEFLKQQLSNLKSKEQVKETPVLKRVEPKKKEKETKYVKAEKALVFYMLKNPEVIHIYDKKITYMPTKNYRLLAREISYFYKQYGMINVADFMSFVADNEELATTLNELVVQPFKDSYTVSEIEDYIKTILDYNISVEIERLKGLMRKELDPLKKAVIASQIMSLKVRGVNTHD